MENKEYVIKKNRKVNIIVDVCLLAVIPAIVLFLIFNKYRSDLERVLVCVGFAVAWLAFFTAHLYFVLWKISFNGEELKVRHFFFTKTYKRDNVIGIEEPHERREGFRSLTPFKKYVAICYVIRRLDNNRKIAEIKDHFENSKYFKLLLSNKSKKHESK